MIKQTIGMQLLFSIWSCYGNKYLFKIGLYKIDVGLHAVHCRENRYLS